MAVDNELVMSDEQAVTATAASTHVINTGSPNLGDTPGLRWQVWCTETAVSGGATTVDIALQCDDAEGFPSAATKLTKNFAKAAIVAGTKLIDEPLPDGLEKYLRTNYTVNTANLTAGKFISAITLGHQTDRNYPAGYTPGY